MNRSNYVARAPSDDGVRANFSPAAEHDMQALHDALLRFQG